MEFPERVHAFDEPADAAQRAFPEASEVRTYPSEAHDVSLNHWNEPVPATVSLSVGVMVQIPTLPLLSPVAPIPVP
jgi:hypothetical protein